MFMEEVGNKLFKFINLSSTCFNNELKHRRSTRFPKAKDKELKKF